MDNKDIAIIVLSVLLTVTLAVLIYLITTKGRSTIPVGYGGGQYGHDMLPNEISPQYYAYRNTQGANIVDNLKYKHATQLSSMYERDRRIMNEGPSVWDYLSSPFRETTEDAKQRQAVELIKLQQKTQGW